MTGKSVAINLLNYHLLGHNLQEKERQLNRQMSNHKLPKA